MHGPCKIRGPERAFFDAIFAIWPSLGSLNQPEGKDFPVLGYF